MKLDVPFLKSRNVATLDLTKVKSRNVATLYRRLYTYFEIPSFDIANTWRGASEIVATFDYDLESNLAFQETFPLVPPSGTTALLTVMWRPGPNQIKRYKLFKDVGEILYLPLYSGQTIGRPFSIEVWNVGPSVDAVIGEGGIAIGEGGLVFRVGELLGEPVNAVLPEAIRLYTSKTVVPTSKCDSFDIALGSYTSCVDPQFDLTDFQPNHGDYYVLGLPCERTLVKVPLQRVVPNILQDRDDGTWHYFWAQNDGGNINLVVDPADAIPPADALGYAPMRCLANGKTYKFQLERSPGDEVNHSFVIGDETTPFPFYGIGLLEEISSQTPTELYGFFLTLNESGNVVFEVLQNNLA